MVLNTINTGFNGAMVLILDSVFARNADEALTRLDRDILIIDIKDKIEIEGC